MTDPLYILKSKDVFYLRSGEGSSMKIKAVAYFDKELNELVELDMGILISPSGFSQVIDGKESAFEAEPSITINENIRRNFIEYFF